MKRTTRAVLMRLANYGMIGLNGTVKRPEPGANFSDYQSGLVSYQMSLSLKQKIDSEAPLPLDQRLNNLAASIKKSLVA
jgi:hypothetical protein